MNYTGYYESINLEKEELKMEFEKTLVDAIETQFGELDKLEVGTEQHVKTADVVAKFMDRAIEIKKLEIEREDRLRAQQFENEAKLAQMKEEHNGRLIQNVISVGGIILPLAAYGFGLLISLKFEETGTITTSAGRISLTKILSRK